MRKAQYAIALALIEEGEVVLGILGCPNLPYDSDDKQSGGTVFYAVQGDALQIEDKNNGVSVISSMNERRKTTVKGSFCS